MSGISISTLRRCGWNMRLVRIIVRRGGRGEMGKGMPFSSLENEPGTHYALR
jgi:hypothetical protein